MNEQAQQQQVTLTFGDLASVVQLIDVVSRRGAIQGNELAGVGALRNKLETYLGQNGVITEQGQLDQEAAGQAVEAQSAPAGELGDRVIG